MVSSKCFLWEAVEVPSGEERGLLSRTAAGNRAHCRELRKSCFDGAKSLYGFMCFSFVTNSSCILNCEVSSKMHIMSFMVINLSIPPPPRY